MSTQPPALRVPSPVRAEVDEIVKVTDVLCEEHLDTEYAALCRKLTAKLARKRPSPLARGDLRIWSAGIVHAVGAVNFLFDRSQSPHLSAEELANLLAVSKSTMANKSRHIRRLLDINRLDVDLCRRELLERHPLAWLIEVDGFVVDARWMPPEIQAEAVGRGLIPPLPAPEIGDPLPTLPAARAVEAA
jgi:hypothetical protein